MDGQRGGGSWSGICYRIVDGRLMMFFEKLSDDYLIIGVMEGCLTICDHKTPSLSKKTSSFLRYFPK